jgi:hypothetical protein
METYLSLELNDFQTHTLWLLDSCLLN